MDDLFMILILIGIGGIFYFRKKDKKKRNISIVVAIVSFILFGITSPDVEDGHEKSEEPETEEVTEKDDAELEKEQEEVETEDPKEPELTTEERIEQLANEHLGQVDDFRYVEGVEEGTEYISVNAQISDNLTTNMTRKGFIMNIKNFVESIKNESFGEVYVGGYADMVDQYGNESNYEVISFSMLKETVDKINFDNISIENFENVADNINVHPALQE